ncbi:hypothetical protein BV22DRAFT_1051378 [Leucogyrophana mollusca]|uniref:Uncharacterized protein n=1 Tax=Leucogyrophana mollusca TaxID=85980 RepID=A0ACB8B2M7_9AGAM|nr:hypothetical protein BV22DRAFT_1051378 [Leucogyrophana mollusca]
MFAKFTSFAYFVAVFLACLSLLVSASPIPFVITGTEGIAPFEDVVAREFVSSNIIRGPEPNPVVAEAAVTYIKREPEPEPVPESAIEEEIDVEPRICRFGFVFLVESIWIEIIPLDAGY